MGDCRANALASRTWNGCHVIDASNPCCEKQGAHGNGLTIQARKIALQRRVFCKAERGMHREPCLLYPGRLAKRLACHSRPLQQERFVGDARDLKLGWDRYFCWQPPKCDGHTWEAALAGKAMLLQAVPQIFRAR